MSLATLEIAVEDGELSVTLFIDNKVVTVCIFFIYQLKSKANYEYT
jgi:hypothetical protein